MGQIVPDPVERYLSSLNRVSDSVLQDIAREGQEQNLPLVDAEVGVLLRVLTMAVRATRILEIGTAIGYSGIWMAGALPEDGMLLTMEVDEQRVREARDNFTRRSGEARQRDQRERAAPSGQGVGPLRPDLSGRRQVDVRADAQPPRRFAPARRPAGDRQRA